MVTNTSLHVPYACSLNMVEKMQKVLSESPARLDLLLGGHGFDAEVPLEYPWVTEECKLSLNKYWP